MILLLLGSISNLNEMISPPPLLSVLSISHSKIEREREGERGDILGISIDLTLVDWIGYWLLGQQCWDVSAGQRYNRPFVTDSPPSTMESDQLQHVSSSIVSWSQPKWKGLSSTRRNVNDRILRRLSLQMKSRAAGLEGWRLLFC